MNERDSEMIMGMLIEKGHQIVETEEEADFVLFNTCSVRQHAEDRVVGTLQKLAFRKAKERDLRIGVLGCMAQRHGELLMKEFPQVDLVVGTNDIYDLPAMIEKACGREKMLAVDTKVRPKKGPDPAYRAGTYSAFVNIMYGCDNFCSYCIVPHVRGREISRPKKDIVKEVKTLAEKGFKEITLLGQNVNSYGKSQTQPVDFVEILEAVNEISGINRIRFVTSHPKDADKQLFKAMRDLSKVCEHIHLPMQSGSNKMLDLMNRKYTIEEYREKVSMLREFVPDVGISTDIIVGFPSEKDSDYEATRRAIEEIKFNSSFVFKYSPRPPAVSACLVDDVSEEIKKKRNNELLEVQKAVSLEVNMGMIGTLQEVLVEGKSRMSENELVGRTRNNTSCVFPADKDLTGKVVKVRIKDTSPYTLKGVIAGGGFEESPQDGDNTLFSDNA